MATYDLHSLASTPTPSTFLPYIESHAKEYIDTGIIPDANTRVEADFEAMSVGRGTYYIFGTIGKFAFRYNGSSKKFNAASNAEVAFSNTILETTRHTVSMTQTSCVIDGDSSNAITLVAPSSALSYNLFLFAYNNSGTASSFSRTRLYSCKIYSGETLVRDFKPYCNADGNVGLLDLVENKFYGNLGTVGFGTTISLNAGDIINYTYTNGRGLITLPSGKYKLEVWGARGGYRSSATYAGKGGYSVGTITLDKATNVFLYPGGQGGTLSTANTSNNAGGFNGGGYRYGFKGGGGGSDIRIGTDSLYARVIVAGGGGSDGATSNKGMYGGGTSGGDATESFGSYGYGGTQTGHTTSVTIPSTQPTTNSSSNYPGGFGFGGFGIYRSSGYGGAGGGGWYGGCGSYPDSSGDDDRGGGGGSGYVYTSSTASNYPSGCLLNSSYYLTDAATYAGNTSFTGTSGSSETGHSGNGYCRITVIELYTSFALNVNIGNTWKEVDSAYVNIGGTWKEIEGIWANIGGTWKESG